MVAYDAREGYYSVAYEDEDKEELEEAEVLPLVTQLPETLAPHQGTAAGPQQQQQQGVPPKRRPGRPPKARAAGAGGDPAGAGTAAAAAAQITPEEVAAALGVAQVAGSSGARPLWELPGRRSGGGSGSSGGGGQQLTLTGGDKRWRRMAKTPVGVQGDPAASWQAPEVAPAGVGEFAPCGAGHARGVAAYDGGWGEGVPC